MIIRIVEHRGSPPEGSSAGTLVWIGGQNPLREEISIPASILTGLAPELEVGTWYAFDDFNRRLEGATPTEAAPWTTISVEQDGPDGRFVAAIESNQEQAAHLVALAAIEFGKGRGAVSDLWVRVE